MSGGPDDIKLPVTEAPMGYYEVSYEPGSVLMTFNHPVTGQRLTIGFPKRETIDRMIEILLYAANEAFGPETKADA